MLAGQRAALGRLLHVTRGSQLLDIYIILIHVVARIGEPRLKLWVERDVVIIARFRREFARAQARTSQDGEQNSEFHRIPPVNDVYTLNAWLEPPGQPAEKSAPRPVL